MKLYRVSYIRGQHVTLAGNRQNGVSFISEGIETGLSIRQAVSDAHVVATLGKHNIKNINPDALAQKIILIADNDGYPLQQDKQLMAAAEMLKQADKSVYVVMPESLGAKTDMNDALKAKGTAGVIDTLKTGMLVFEGGRFKSTNDLSGIQRISDLKGLAESSDFNQKRQIAEEAGQQKNVDSNPAQSQADRQKQFEQEL